MNGIYLINLAKFGENKYVLRMIMALRLAVATVRPAYTAVQSGCAICRAV